MTNTEKLKSLMREYGVERVFHYSGMDFESDFLTGKLFFDGMFNKEFLTKVYEIFTPDGYLQDGQDLDLWMEPEGSHDFKLVVKDTMEVMYA